MSLSSFLYFSLTLSLSHTHIHSSLSLSLTHTHLRAKGLGIAISLGELSKESYTDLFRAGAHRYLLRIETANPDLYKLLHPPDHSWENRVRCLRDLRDVGYQVGTGNMVNLPGQTMTDLARDLMFFREMDVDMIGCGPYIMQTRTPIGEVGTESLFLWTFFIPFNF